MGGAVGGGDASRLRHALQHAAHRLPIQGPIGVFVHHNTLHAFQHIPFEQAVLEASKAFRSEPFLTEAGYRAAQAKGRILDVDLDVVLAREPDATVLPGRLTRRQLLAAWLKAGCRTVPAETIPWHLEEGDWLERFRDDLSEAARKGLAGTSPRALWECCLARVPRPVGGDAVMPRRPADVVAGLDEAVHPTLIRLAGAFLDQGVAYWPMPLRCDGFFRACVQLLSRPASIAPPGLEGLKDAFQALGEARVDAEAAVLQCLGELGVPPGDWDGFVEAELLALPGWAGMMSLLESKPGLAPHIIVPARLVDFLAVRLVLMVTATRGALGGASAWRSRRVPAEAEGHLERVASVFDAAQVVGLGAAALAALDDRLLGQFVEAIQAAGPLERRRILHLAYERRHERLILVPLRQHLAAGRLSRPQGRPMAQMVFCIDDREESIRRAIEEIEPSIETHGAAGFFGCAIDYAGIDDAGPVSLCPVVVTPQHAVREGPAEGHADTHERRRALRRLWSRWVRSGNVASQTLVRGLFSTIVLGFFSLFPLVLRVLSPLGYARMVGWLNARFLPEPRTELRFMRHDESAREATRGLFLGFSVSEMADRVGNVLGPMGMKSGHARLVVVLGHGSTSLNNPHESAYDCGACGGRQGGPNARLFATLANHPQVRAELRSRGLVIPDDTWFLGGYHDTCSDDIDLFDLDRMPATHGPDLAALRAVLDQARQRNAHERVRRFEVAPPSLAPEEALRHVMQRSEHLGEPRPEYGHSTNAVAFVGRRDTTRGLFLDRRAFLVSYDLEADPTARFLGNILGAVIPVCGGISLEYYFSTVDNEVLGCGTKLPHNVTGLVGVMNGMQGDLRTGLTWQMVEIHEPVRILFVVENSPEVVLRVIHANPELKEWLENRWIRLACVDAPRAAISVYRGDGVFEPLEGDDVPLPRVRCSADHYRGHRGHLPLARIEAGSATHAACCDRH